MLPLTCLANGPNWPKHKTSRPDPRSAVYGVVTFWRGLARFQSGMYCSSITNSFETQPVEPITLVNVIEIEAIGGRQQTSSCQQTRVSTLPDRLDVTLPRLQAAETDWSWRHWPPLPACQTCTNVNNKLPSGSRWGDDGVDPLTTPRSSCAVRTQPDNSPTSTIHKYGGA